MDIEYIRNLNHNYLKIPCLDDDTLHLYQYKMIMNNHIQGLLQCDIRKVDGISYLYYDISSTQSVANRFLQKEMDSKWIRDFFIQLKMVAEQLEKHLLDSGNLVFNPDCIFQDIETGDTFFLYYPYYDSELSSNFGKLAGYMVTKIEHKDDTMVQKVYQLYEKVELSKEFLCLPELLLIMEEESTHQEKSSYNNQEQELWLKENGSAENERPVPQEHFYEKPEELSIKKELSEQHINSKRKRQSEEKKEKWLPPVIIIIVGVLLVMIWNYSFLSQKETLLLSGIGAVIIVVMGMKIYHYFINERNTEKVKNTETEQNGTEAERPEDTLIEKAMVSKAAQITSEYAQPISSTNTAYGKTIYLEGNDLEPERKLYGTGKHNKIILTMDKFPYTIGKRKEYVDGIINDTSVSRMHARFFEKEKILFMEDLNSTNGTFKNGLRLDPNETVEVEVGDEIQFGKMLFTYR